MVAFLAAIAVAAGVPGVHWLVHSSKNPVDAATVWSADLGAVAIAVSLLTLIATWWAGGSGRSAKPLGTSAQVAAAADWLAETAAARWRREAVARRIITPAPATVRWRWASADLTSPRPAVTVAPVPGTGPAPMPDLGRPGELLSSGVVTRLHDEVYARLPQGRLVLIGGPGSGKTGAMILLLLAALERRGSLAADQRARVPVPVWLTLGGWNPVADSLRTWAAAAMSRDFPALRAPDYGAGAASRLLESGRVALFLDGLDEMPAYLRNMALKRLDDEARDLRVVVTSRPQEYQLALRDGRPDSTAVIELRPVRPEAAAAFLLHEQAGQSRERWEQFGGYLRSHPDSAAARALDNPLTLSLARDAYAGQDPVVLTDPDRFPGPEAISEHLIDRFLMIAYPREIQRERAIRWLAWIAWHMGASQDLQWWDIPGWVSPWRLRLARGLVAGLAAWLLVTIMASLTYARTRGLAGGLTAGQWSGIAAALGIGLIAALVTRLGTRPTGAPGPARAGGAVVLAFSMLAVAWMYAGPVGLVIMVPVVVVARLVIMGISHGRRRPPAGRPRGPLLERPLIRSVVISSALAAALGLWGERTNGTSSGIGEGNLGFLVGVLFGLVFLSWSGRGFGLAGAPQALALRRPRRLWLAPLWVLLFPLLIPVLLNSWATPIADSPSATAAGTYRADRRAAIIYASVYSLALGTATGLYVALNTASAPTEATRALPLGIGWGLAVGLLTWLTAWIAAGRASLVVLTQLTLDPWQRDNLQFARFLEDASSRQVLRQAGAVYQFRHAAIQTHLAGIYCQLRNMTPGNSYLPTATGSVSTPSAPG